MIEMLAMVLALATPAGHCTAPQGHQFDFWIGSYLVRNAAGKLEGTDTIERAYGGCALQEHFRAADGSSYGSSFSFFDSDDMKWHYVWVDNLGAFEIFSGGLNGGSMVLFGLTRSTGNRRVEERMTWTPLPGHRIRQLWQYSLDGGAVWRTMSDVYYWPR
jgi:hypothetical protein